MATEQQPGQTRDWSAPDETSPAEAHRAAVERTSIVDERTEIVVGAAFAGGFLLAQALKWLGPDRD